MVNLLLDNFTGAGTILTVPPDVGGAWANFGGGVDPSHDGAGFLIVTNTATPAEDQSILLRETGYSWYAEAAFKILAATASETPQIDLFFYNAGGDYTGLELYIRLDMATGNWLLYGYVYSAGGASSVVLGPYSVALAADGAIHTIRLEASLTGTVLSFDGTSVASTTSMPGDSVVKAGFLTYQAGAASSVKIDYVAVVQVAPPPFWNTYVLTHEG